MHLRGYGAATAVAIAIMVGGALPADLLDAVRAVLRAALLDARVIERADLHGIGRDEIVVESGVVEFDDLRRCAVALEAIDQQPVT